MTSSIIATKMIIRNSVKTTASVVPCSSLFANDLEMAFGDSISRWYSYLLRINLKHRARRPHVYTGGMSFQKRILLGLLVVAGGVVLWPGQVMASPFGQGKFGADVPFGSATSLSIDVGSDAAISLSPSGANFSGTGSNTVTVTTTDVVGYYLYAHTTGTTNMVNGSATIAASSNSSDAPLAVGTWGYNTTGSTTNFLGMTATNSLLKDASGPFKNGDATTVTYGALVSGTQEAGNYSVAVTYTAVAKDQ